jgi:6-phosphogluconolactonase (cycloisomerase 2 family)
VGGGQSKPGLITQSGTPQASQPGTPQAPQHFLYGRNGTSIFGFGEDKTGALSPLPGSPFAIDPTNPATGPFTSDPQGRFFFIPDLLAVKCCIFEERVLSVDFTSGVVGSHPIQSLSDGRFAYHPSGKFLYIATRPTTTIVTFFSGIEGIDLSTSNLAQIPGSTFSNGQNMDFISIDPAGHFLYTSGELNPGTSTPTPAFETYVVDSNTGMLTLISTDTSPGVQPSGPILFHPAGKFGYALNTRSGNQVVDLYSVNASTGALTFLSTQVNSTLSNPIMSSNRNFLYGCVPLSNQPCLPVAYRTDSNTGALTQISGFSLGQGDGGSLVIDKSGQFAYALITAISSGNPSNQIFVYSIDSSTGLMTQLPNLTATLSAGITNIAAGR